MKPIERHIISLIALILVMIAMGEIDDNQRKKRHDFHPLPVLFNKR